MLYFATFFDKNYLSRGLVLYESLRQHCQKFELYILCLDDFTANYFSRHAAKYPDARIVRLHELENADKELTASKANRNAIEYYFTISPCLPFFLLKKFGLSHICSLDADMLFLSDPSQIFKSLDEYSIIITPHKFSPEVKYLDKFGMYNVCFQVFKNDACGLACLAEWRRQCIEWCRDEFDQVNNRFADQKYLDGWANLYPGKVKELYDNVSGIAPWNLNNFAIMRKDNSFFSNGERIIFYHFHHFKLLRNNWASSVFNFYNAKFQNGVEELYFFYWDQIISKNQELALRPEGSTRFNHSDSLLNFLLSQKSVYYRTKGGAHILIRSAWIPSFMRTLLMEKNG